MLIDLEKQLLVEKIENLINEIKIAERNQLLTIDLYVQLEHTLEKLVSLRRT